MSVRDMIMGAAGGAGGSEKMYVEDVFSTYLYNGNSAGLTINNGIDLAGKGGMVWGKTRNAANKHVLFDTVRGPLNELSSNLTAAQENHAQSLTAFTSTGYTLGNDDWTSYSNTFQSVSWTFRKQPKFFDVVTYTGNDVAGRQIPHSLGSAPGCILIKSTNAGYNWIVYHRGANNGVNPENYFLSLNETSAQVSALRIWNNTAPTSTSFTLGDSGGVNSPGTTYVAYLFAHDAGGFGLSGNENVVSCGSYTTDGSGNATVNLGYEPQWFLRKRSDAVSDWIIVDNMRGWATGNTNTLAANDSAIEYGGGYANQITSTGFSVTSDGASRGYIYIAIRRGPMKVPTDGTKVFAPVAATTGTQTTGFPVDMMMQFSRTSNDIYSNTEVVDRLRGISSNSTAQSNYLLTTSTGATDSLGAINASKAWTNTGFDVPPAYAGSSNGFECFRRAPSFFDEVCYAGTGVARTVTHNLGVVPELMIVKRRDASQVWAVYSSTIGATNYLLLNSTAAEDTASTLWNNTAPTLSVFTVGDAGSVNTSTGTYVAYLFATCPGVSKVGSYTGTGATQAIACGFTAGARFVMIKRTDAVGDWYVWDSARGIVAGNDPYLLLNSTAVETASTDYIDPSSAGFEISSTAPAAINASGGTYIFLAIA